MDMDGGVRAVCGLRQLRRVEEVNPIERPDILVCYEQLLTWPMLRSATEKPTILIAISNESWTAATTVPRIQHACVRAWARLFGLPVISAINS